MEEMKSHQGNVGWKALNTVLGVGGLATALGVGIPALVKANKAEDIAFNRYGYGGCGGHGHGGCNNGYGYGAGYDGCCGENTVVNRFELKQSEKIACLEANEAKLKSELYTDKAVEKAVCKVTERNDAEIGRINSAIFQMERTNDARFAHLDKEGALTKQALAYESKIAHDYTDCKTKELFEYVNGHFVKGKLIMPLDSICPKPLAGCTPVVVSPQVITTTTATTEGEADV